MSVSNRPRFAGKLGGVRYTIRIFSVIR